MGQKRSRRRICASTALTTSDLAAARRTLIACCWGSAVVRAFGHSASFLQNAFSAIANPDGCTWDEAEILLGKGNSFSAGCRFWAVPEAAGLKAFRKEVSCRNEAWRFCGKNKKHPIPLHNIHKDQSVTAVK